MPSTPGASADVATLLSPGAASVEAARKLAQRLDLDVLPEIERLVREKVGAGQLDAADSMLTMTERAARLAGVDAIRYWARINRGSIAAMRKDDARAQSLLEEGFESLDQPSVLENETLRRAYSAAGDLLFNRAFQGKNIAAAREVLGRMLHRVQGTGLGSIEARIVTKLLWLSLSTEDVSSAEQYGLLLLGDDTWNASAADKVFRDSLVELLRTAVSQLYEAGEARYEAALSIGRVVESKAGPDGPTLLFLALMASAVKNFADALVWLDRLLEAPKKLLPGYDVSRLHHRRAICLLNLNRRTDAVAAIHRAIDIAPADPFVRFAAAQVPETLGDYSGAIAEYERTIRLCEERLAKPQPVSAGRSQPRSMSEYEANTPVEDLRDFATMRRSMCLRSAGRQGDAVAELEKLLTIADEASQCSALTLLAEWAEEEGRLDDAASLLTRARAASSSPSDDVDLHLAAVLIRQRRFDDVLELLAPLCHKSRKPEKCVDLLDNVPKDWTGYARVLRLRGYAKTEGGWPREGMADLDAAVTAGVADADTLLMRALARITFGVQRDQQDWNASRTMRHIRESLNDLYAARKLRPDHAEVVRVMQWLVERTAANPDMYEIFAAGGSREGDLFAAFPGLKSAFEMASKAESLGIKRQFADCAAAWSKAMQTYEQLGFGILAATIHVRLADVYLRLLELDQAAAQLDRADNLRFLVDVPLSLDVQQQYREFVAERGVYAQPTLGREVEYAWIYDHSAYYALRLAFVKGNYRQRVGDVKGALECVELVLPVLGNMQGLLDSFFGIDEVMWVVSILRDAERYDDALRLLDGLEHHAEETQRSFDVLYARGLIHDIKGESPLAIEAYERAFAVKEQRSRAAGIAPYLQYAASLLNAGQTANALRTLQQIDIEHAADSDRDRLMYYTVAAGTYASLQAHAEALSALARALAIAEARRAAIPDVTTRRAWQGQQQNLYSIAVKLYADMGRPGEAWHNVELSKARTLLDELAGRAALSPEHGVLIGDLDTVEEAIRVVERGMSLGTAEDSAALRTEGMATLARILESRFRDVISSRFFTERDLPKLKDMLVERHAIIVEKERQVRDVASRAVAVVIRLDELTALMVT